MKTFEQIAELEKRYLLGTYNRYPLALTRGKGVFLYDLEDRRYLDFVAGVGGEGVGGECVGARASADCEDDSRAGFEADSRLQSLLPRVSRGAGGEVVHTIR